MQDQNKETAPISSVVAEASVTPKIEEPKVEPADTQPTPTDIKEPLTGEEETQPVEVQAQTNPESPQETGIGAATPDTSTAAVEEKKPGLLARLFGRGK